MVSIEEIKPNNDRNNRIIQKVLKEIDRETAVCLCAKLRDDRAIIFRNLSEQVLEQIKEELKTREVYETKQNRAYNLFQKKISRYVENPVPEKSGSNTKKLIFDSIEDIRNSCIDLYYQNNDIIQLEKSIREVENPIVKKMLEFVLYSYDPLKAEMLMEKIIDKAVHEYSETLNCLKEAALSILLNEQLEDLIDKIDVYR